MPKKKLSRQRLWQIKRKAEGLCMQCGKPRPPELARRCRTCQTKRTKAGWA